MAVSFAQDIRPLFTDMDIAHMKGFGVLLDDCEGVGSALRSRFSTCPGRGWCFIDRAIGGR